MRMLLATALALVLAGSGMAQHGGGGGHGGGIGGHGGGIGGIGHGGIGIGHAGGIGIGHSGGIGIGHGGIGSIGHGYIGSGFGSHGIGLYYGSHVYPWYGLGYSYWPGYYGPYWGYPYSGAYASYDYSYQPSPNVTVIYPPSQAASTPVDRARPVTREYDEYGQEVRSAAGDNRSASSPIYLIAFKDNSIRAASAYWVDGETLHYITLQREERRVALATVDREFSSQLNRERRVSFQLPAQ